MPNQIIEKLHEAQKTASTFRLAETFSQLASFLSSYPSSRHLKKSFHKIILTAQNEVSNYEKDRKTSKPSLFFHLKLFVGVSSILTIFFYFFQYPLEYYVFTGAVAFFTLFTFSLVNSQYEANTILFMRRLTQMIRLLYLIEEEIDE